jgi:DNA-binding SARP family transcriptional activator/predicted ATPase
MRFLGMAELALDGVPVRLQRRHSLAMLAYLVLTRRPHSRDELATLLAGDVADAPARKLLRNALADLVAHGLGDFLLTSRQSVAFNAAMPHTVDVNLLDDLLGRGAYTSADTLEWAVQRSDWELLAGLTLPDAPLFDLWLLNEREHRRQQLVAIANGRLEQHLWSGRSEAGIALARRVLAVEPWQEETHRLLMRLLARDGQLSAALAQYDRCRHALAEELGAEPQSETTALVERLRAGPVAPRHNLPVPILEDGEILGRAVELDELARGLIDPACRLLTVVGLGGSGKTSLALAAAAQLTAPAPLAEEHPFADGVFLVSLADLAEPAAGGESRDDAERHVVTSIGLALGLVFYGRIDRLEQVIAYLESKRLLLILDNMEHSFEGVPALQAILRGAPGLTLLVTSRVPLSVPEEWTHELGMLPLPEGPDDLEQSPAGQLFLREARRANVTLPPDDRQHVVEVCQLTGGLPLALKIAAGWMGALTCAEIARELRHTGALLREPAPRPQRPRTSIHAVMVAAFESLPARERQALSRLAVFPLRFDRPAAEAIGVPFPSVVTLCQRSLVERGTAEGYRLHPLVRQHAAEQLASRSSEHARACARHGAHYAALVDQHSAALFQHPEAHAAIGADHANVQAAWDWAVTRRDVELIARLLDGLATWNEQAGLHREFRDDRDDPERVAMLARLLIAQAESLLWQGELERAFPLLDEARHCASTIGALHLEARVSLCEGRLLRYRGDSRAVTDALQQARILARATRQPRIEATSLLQLSFAAVDSEHYAEAEPLLRRAEEEFRTLGERLTLGRIKQHRGRLYTIWGDFDRAQIELEQSLHTARAFGDRFLEAISHVYLGVVRDAASGWHREADEHFERALAIERQTGDPYLFGNIHRAMGRNALHAGDMTRAARSFASALDRARDVGNTRAVCDSLCCLAQLACASGDHHSAEDRAQQALRMALDAGRQHAAASALLVLGQTRERLGRLSDAASAYTQAAAIAGALGLPYVRCDATTGLASVSLAAGDVSLAARYVEDILPYLREQALAGCGKPGWVALTCFRVLDAAHDPRAASALRLGAEILERRALLLPPPRRNQYLAAFPDRGAVLQRWKEYAEEVPSAVSFVIQAPAALPVTGQVRPASQPVAPKNDRDRPRRADEASPHVRHPTRRARRSRARGSPRASETS